jgi:Flp pilus assembly protein TadG
MLSLRRASARRYARRGSIVLLVAISLSVILSFLAICVDGGGLLERRRHAQATADAAAIAAAEALFRSYPDYHGVDADGSAANAATSIAALNGFSNDGTTSVVTVRTAPDTYSGGPNAGMPLPSGYVEVSVQYNQKRYFSAILGKEDIPVQARAVARGQWEAADVAVHVLDLHESASLTSTGESSVTVSGAKIIVNSDASSAATSTGGTITAPTMDITGGSSVSGSKGGFNAEINYGVPPEPDPLRNIPEPKANGYSLQSNAPVHFSDGTRSLQPGTYRGGISVSGKGTLDLAPGVYYMDGGGFSFSGQGNLSAEGVMIFSAPERSSDTVSITGTGSIIISPPTSGIYKGLTLFQARYSPNTMSVSGGGYMDISGTFYTANGTLQVGGGGDSKIGSQYVSRFLSIVGGGGLFIDYNKAEALPRRVLQLVE